MNTQEKQELIKNFLGKQKLGIIATLHENGAPEAAAIQVTLADDGNIVFDCFPESRKFKNIYTDKRIALVVGWEDNITVQIEGDVVPITDVNEKKKLEGIHVANCPLEAEFLKYGAQLFKIKPRWVRYSDFRNNPSVIFELR